MPRAIKNSRSTPVLRKDLAVSTADVPPGEYASVRDFFRGIAKTKQAPVVLAKP